MKRIILSTIAMVLLSSPAIHSQTMAKVDKAGVLKKIERSNEEVANPKKSDKVSTWLNRGKVFVEAATEISKNVYENMPKSAADMILGNAAAEAAVVNNKQYTKLTYPIMVVYADENELVKAWEIKNVIYDGALEEAAAAYDKAHQLDAASKNADKINAGFQDIFNEYSKQGANMFALGQFVNSGSMFEKALKLAENPGFTKLENKYVQSLSHDTGLAYFFGGNYRKAIDYLSKAESLGYEREGEIYYLLYHAYKGLAAGDKEIFRQVEPILERGFTKYPDNSNLIEVTTDLYVALDKNPREIVPIVLQAIENNPEDASLWNGLGRIYERLGDLDQSIAAFAEVAKLTPDNFNAFYSQGILYIRKADSMMDKVNAASYKDQAGYDAAKATTFVEYGKAIPPLETAHRLNPKEPVIVELLKNITFRLREEPGMAEKNAKYTAILNELKK